MEGLDGAKGAGVGLPVEVAQGQTGDEAWRKELVDVVRVKVLDWVEEIMYQRRKTTSTTRKGGGSRRIEGEKPDGTCHFGG